MCKVNSVSRLIGFKALFYFQINASAKNRLKQGEKFDLAIVVGWLRSGYFIFYTLHALVELNVLATCSNVYTVYEAITTIARKWNCTTFYTRGFQMKFCPDYALSALQI